MSWRQTNGAAIGTVVITYEEWSGPAQADGWPDTRHRVGSHDEETGRSIDRKKTYKGELAWANAERLFGDLVYREQRNQVW